MWKWQIFIISNCLLPLTLSHIHFQYNGFMFGILIWSMTCMLQVCKKTVYNNITISQSFLVHNFTSFYLKTYLLWKHTILTYSIALPLFHGITCSKFDTSTSLHAKYYMLNKSFLYKTNNFVFSFDKYAKIIF